MPRDVTEPGNGGCRESRHAGTEQPAGIITSKSRDSAVPRARVSETESTAPRPNRRRVNKSSSTSEINERLKLTLKYDAGIQTAPGLIRFRERRERN